VLDFLREGQMPGESVIYYIGVVTTTLFALVILGILWGILFGLFACRWDLYVFPRLTFFLLEKLRSPFKVLFSFFTRDRYLVERMAIKVLNRVYRKKYAAVPVKDRMVIMPQCLRDLECPAPTDPRTGIACKRCGKCVVEKVRKLNGTQKIYISPGGTFSVRILESARPPAVLGVACPRDLFEGMAVCHSLRIPIQGVTLLRTGCVATEVDFDELARTLLVGEERKDAQRQEQYSASN
jgi:hypothetical protein